jgi:two-component system cell cycle sensor histidine kinase/response regulator CckA
MTFQKKLPPPEILNQDSFDGLLGTLLHSVPEGVHIVDRSGKVLFINEKMREMWEFPLDMPNDEAQNFAKLLVLNPKKFVQRIKEIHIVEGHIPEETVTLLNGKVYARNTKPIMINNVYQGRVWTYRNITEQYHTQYHTQELLENIFEHAPVAIALADRNGNMTRVNNAWTEILGFSEQEILHTSFSQQTHPDDKDACINAIKSLLSGQEKSVHLEKRYIHKDQSVINTFAHISILSPGQDTQIQDELLIAQIVDLTQLKKAEQALFQHQKLESIGVLAGGIAHDFNNLLVAIKAQSSVALRKLEKGDDATQNIEKVMMAADNAAYLTEQLLAYSGQRQFEVENVNINLQIEQQLGILNIAIPKNVVLTTNLLPSLPEISAEKGQMQQILLNLIINAAESMEKEPGEIIINTDEFYFGPEQILTTDDFILEPQWVGPHIRLTIADTGKGMDKETISKVFDPFFTTKFTGRGLGLAAVLGIVKSHKGALHISSEPNSGTTFDIYLPSLLIETSGLETSKSNSNKAKGNRSKPHPENDTKSTVLLIDDDKYVRQALTDLFEYENIKLICASDGKEGIEKLLIHKNKIAFTLLDLSMPGLSSVDTFTELRKIDPELPIVLCSGYSESAVGEAFEGKQFVGFISKPFEVDHLIDTVQKYLLATAKG